jgi:hypothetical protein
MKLLSRLLSDFSISLRIAIGLNKLLFAIVIKRYCFGLKLHELHLHGLLSIVNKFILLTTRTCARRLKIITILEARSIFSDVGFCHFHVNYNNYWLFNSHELQRKPFVN